MQVALGGGASECVSLCVRAVCVCVSWRKRKEKWEKKMFLFLHRVHQIYIYFCQKEVGLIEA